MTREEMWKEFENQLIRETRTSMTMSFDSAERMTKLGIEETVAKWKKRLEQTRWTPVIEMLPEDGTWNMFMDGKQISVERFKLDAINHFFPEGRWFSFDEAVAWMPLPQPYKAESEVQE